jgi:dTDP-4-dehydrorhamnose reductase
MKWLIYGGKGWIGGQITKILEQNPSFIVVVGKSRIDNYQDTRNEITRVKPDRVVCTVGRTSGPGCPNIDYLEQPGKLVENLRDNLYGPLNLARICDSMGIHLTYMGTGCIFEFDDEHRTDLVKGFTEQDDPNFFGSQYSVVKGFTDKLLRNGPNVLNVRIRMPITADLHPRNFITKILKYDKVISVTNSMTVLSELLPMMLKMSINREAGTVNLTNPGAINHQEILEMYKEIVDPSYTYEIMDLEELNKHTMAGRSNNYLETNRLQTLFPEVRNVHSAIRGVLEQMVHTTQKT